MKPIEAALLVLLGAIWGLSYMLIRIAAPAFGPLPLMGSRVAIAAAALFAFAFLRGGRPSLGGHRGRFLVLGALNSAIPFALIATGELRLDASLGAILNATSPLFSVFVARIAFGAPLRRAQIAGALVGVAGVAVLVGVGEVSADPTFLVAVGLLLLAALSYAIGASYAARGFPGMRPADLAFGQMIGATVVLLPGAALTLPRSAPPLGAFGALLVIALVCTVVAYVIYFRLIATLGATRTVAVTLLVPIFAVLFGTVLLGEEPTANLFGGMALVLAGVALVTGIVAGPRAAVPPARAA